MKRTLFLISCFSCIVLSSCRHRPDQQGLNRLSENYLSEWNNKLTEIIIADIFTPPVSSRIYAYANIAAYGALLPGSHSHHSYAGKLNGLGPLPSPVAEQDYSYPVASIIAFTTVARKMVFSSSSVEMLEHQYLKQLDSLNMKDDVINSSVAYGRAVGDHILAWSARDGCLQRTSMPAYIVTKEAGRWDPTPPNYSEATETNWKTLRPLALDSCSRFRPPPPVKYDTLKNSAFYKECYQVYDAVKNPKVNDSALAWYWDDNPNTSVTDGHINYFQQKNSPAGHWIYIACSVAKKERFDALKTASLISKTAVALYDAFISCWDAKYTYNYIRPETYINKYIDKNWVLLIQTPPFPEYPSGHSVASNSAATVLARMVNDNCPFTDSAEVPFGRPARNFDSFYAASGQASISRLYGGIHFMNAIRKGSDQGRSVGNYIVEKLK